MTTTDFGHLHQAGLRVITGRANDWEQIIFNVSLSELLSGEMHNKQQQTKELVLVDGERERSYLSSWKMICVMSETGRSISQIV